MKLSRSEAAVLNWGDFDPQETFDKGQTPCLVVETRELLLASWSQRQGMSLNILQYTAQLPTAKSNPG